MFVVLFVFALVFAMATTIVVVVAVKAGAVAVVGLGTRLVLGCVFTNRGASGAASSGTDDGAIFAAYRLPDRSTGGTTYCTAHNGAALAGALGGDCATDCTANCATDYGTVFTAHRLAHCCPGSGARTTSQNGGEIIRKGRGGN